MAFELKEGQGSLFRNDRREKDTHPNARGDALIGGVLYEVLAWTKQGRNGPFQSLSFKPKQPRSEPKPQQSYGQQSGGEDNSDLPF